MSLPLDKSSDKQNENLLTFKPREVVGSLHPVRKNWESCRHKYTVIDEANRTVECRDCHAPLDPFAVLLELAFEQRRLIDDVEGWKARNESMLSDRYDEKWLRHVGDVIEPPSDPEIRAVWDVFHEYFGDRFAGMYHRKTRMRNGMEWYGRGDNGSTVSLMYARSALAARCIDPKTAAKQASEE